MGGGAPGLFNQGGFRGRYDGLGSANNDDTNWLAAENADWNQTLDTKFRVRFYLYQWYRFASVNGYVGLYYSHNGGPHTYLDNSDEIYQADSVLHAVLSDDAGYTDGSHTTELLTSVDPTADYIVTNYGIVEEDRGSDSTPNHTWVGGGGDLSHTNDCEFEWCLTLRSEFVSLGDTIELFVYINDGNLDDTSADGYVEWPTITAVAGAVAGVDNALKIKGDALRLKGSSLIIK